MTALSTKPGLVELLDAAATIIEREAEIIKRSHVMPSGRWATSPFVGDAKKAHDEKMAVANGLRAAREYWEI